MAAPTEAAQSFGFRPRLSSGEFLDAADAEGILKCFLMEVYGYGCKEDEDDVHTVPERDKNEALACLSHHNWNLQQAVPAARAIEDATSKIRAFSDLRSQIRAVKEAGWLTRDEYYQEVNELLRQTAAAIVQCVVQRCLRRTELVRQTAAAIVVQCVVRRKKRCTELLRRQTDAVIVVQRFWRHTEARNMAFVETFTARFRSAENSQAREGAKRHFDKPMVQALLDELEKDLGVATFLRFNDFAYKDRGSNELLVEREYWLQISFSAGALARNPGLTGPEGYAILHVHYAGKWPWPGVRSRPVFLSHRLVITQVNIRHTWCRGVSPGAPFHKPCIDVDTVTGRPGPLHGKWREGHGKSVLVAEPGWKWKDEAEKERSFTWTEMNHETHTRERRDLTGQHASVLRDLLLKGEQCRRVVRLAAPSAQATSASSANAGSAGAPVTGVVVKQYTEPDWSAKEPPHGAPWPFKILFVGVDNGDKEQPDLNLKEEFKMIEEAYRLSEIYRADTTNRVTIKPLPFSQWGEVMDEIRIEMPTALHLGCHAREGRGFELFRQTVEPGDMLSDIVAWNADCRGRDPPRPEIRLIVYNACESENYARDLGEVVDFAIGYLDVLDDVNAIQFSKCLYRNLFDSRPLLDSFNIARSCGQGYRLSGTKDPCQFRLVPFSPQAASVNVSRQTGDGIGAAGSESSAIQKQSQEHALRHNPEFRKLLCSAMCTELIDLHVPKVNTFLGQLAEIGVHDISLLENEENHKHVSDCLTKVDLPEPYKQGVKKLLLMLKLKEQFIERLDISWDIAVSLIPGVAIMTDLEDGKVDVIAQRLNMKAATPVRTPAPEIAAGSPNDIAVESSQARVDTDGCEVFEAVARDPPSSSNGDVSISGHAGGAQAPAPTPSMYPALSTTPANPQTPDGVEVRLQAWQTYKTRPQGQPPVLREEEGKVVADVPGKEASGNLQPTLCPLLWRSRSIVLGRAATPENTAPALHQAQVKGMVVLQLVLDLKMDDIAGNEVDFKDAVRQDLAEALNDSLDKIHILHISAGSIIVVIGIVDGWYKVRGHEIGLSVFRPRNAFQAAQSLVMQAKEEKSPLKDERRRYTKSILSLRILHRGLFSSRLQRLADQRYKMQKCILSQLGHLDDEALAKACDLVYAVMDSNSSGIDYNEFQQGMLQCWGVKFSNKILHKYFNKYDTDESGMISADKFLNLIKELLTLARESKLGAEEGENTDKELPGDVGKKTEETVTLSSGANVAERSLNLSALDSFTSERKILQDDQHLQSLELPHGLCDCLLKSLAPMGSEMRLKDAIQPCSDHCTLHAIERSVIRSDGTFTAERRLGKAAEKADATAFRQEKRVVRKKKDEAQSKGVDDGMASSAPQHEGRKLTGNAVEHADLSAHASRMRDKSPICS